jgi:hypothetical protein
MDGQQFDDLARALSHSRRWLLGLGGSLGLAPFFADAKKRKKKKKKKKKKKNKNTNSKTSTCQKQCSGKTCGPDGCNGSCGTCPSHLVCTQGTCQCPTGGTMCGEECCDICQVCDEARQVCIMKPGSNETPCPGGFCCGGACCPPGCDCGVEGLSGTLAELLAGFTDLPYPACFAKGTGKTCGGLGGGSCEAGITCVMTPVDLGLCIGLCPGVDYPAL